MAAEITPDPLGDRVAALSVTDSTASVGWNRANLILAGIVAGLVAWGLGEATLGLIGPARYNLTERGITLAVTTRWNETTAAIWNAGLAYALLGGALGAGAGLVGGLAARSGRRALVAACLGAVVGALVQMALTGAILTAYGSYRYRHPDEASRDLVLPILAHAVIWAGAGVTAGLAFALGAAHRELASRAALAGAVGAILGTVGFFLAEALVFPSGDTTSFLSPTAIARLAARLAVSIPVMVGIATALADRRNPITPTASTPIA